VSFWGLSTGQVIAAAGETPTLEGAIRAFQQEHGRMAISWTNSVLARIEPRAFFFRG
jgi:hypothetical protein